MSCKYGWEKKARFSQNTFSGLKENMTKQITIRSCWQLLNCLHAVLLSITWELSMQNPVLDMLSTQFRSKYLTVLYQIYIHMPIKEQYSLAIFPVYPILSKPSDSIN